MKTHDFAEALKKLASALKKAPNLDLDDMESFSHLLSDRPPRPPTQPEDIPWALNALLSLSQVDRREWIQLATDLGLSLDIRARDASRDILGKVLRALEAQPEARSLLESRARNAPVKATGSSPELARALSSLLGR